MYGLNTSSGEELGDGTSSIGELGLVHTSCGDMETRVGLCGIPAGCPMY